MDSSYLAFEQVLLKESVEKATVTLGAKGVSASRMHDQDPL